jgi:hypothetical protein
VISEAWVRRSVSPHANAREDTSFNYTTNHKEFGPVRVLPRRSLLATPMQPATRTTIAESLTRMLGAAGPEKFAMMRTHGPTAPCRISFDS